MACAPLPVAGWRPWPRWSTTRRSCPTTRTGGARGPGSEDPPRQPGQSAARGPGAKPVGVRRRTSPGATKPTTAAPTTWAWPGLRSTWASSARTSSSPTRSSTPRRPPKIRTRTASPAAPTTAPTWPRTRTASRTRTAAPRPTTTRTASPTSTTSARCSPRTRTASTTPTAARKTTTTTTASPARGQVPRRARDQERLQGRRRLPRRAARGGQDVHRRHPGHQLQDCARRPCCAGSFPLLDRAVAVLKAVPGHQARDLGPHRLAGQGRLQPRPVAKARRCGEDYLISQGHRRRADRVGGLRPGPPHRRQPDRVRALEEPAHRVPHPERGVIRGAGEHDPDRTRGPAAPGPFSRQLCPGGSSGADRRGPAARPGR